MSVSLVLGLKGYVTTARSQRGRFLKVSLKTNFEYGNIPPLNQHQSGFVRLVILEVEFNRFASTWCPNTKFTVEMCCVIIPPGGRDSLNTGKKNKQIEEKQP